MPIDVMSKVFCQKCHLFVKILKGWFCFQECVLSGNICDPKILNTSSSSLGSVLGQIFYKGEGDRGHCGSSADWPGDYDSNRENDEGKNWHNK